MNIDYIGVEGASLDSGFINGKDLMRLLKDKLQDEDFIARLMKLDVDRDGVYSYSRMGLDPSLDYLVRIVGVHENGIVLEMVCPIDAGSNKYNTANAAFIISKDGEIPKFVVSSIDGRENPHFRDKGDYSFWVPVNIELIESLFNDLGKRVDTKYVGVRPKDNVLTRKINKRNIELMDSHIQNRLHHLSHVLDALENKVERNIRL